MSPFRSHMDLALAHARAAALRGEVPVGAVVISPTGTVIAAAGNRTRELHDPTAHAELLAIRAACAGLGFIGDELVHDGVPARREGRWRSDVGALEGEPVVFVVRLAVTFEIALFCAIHSSVPTAFSALGFDVSAAFVSTVSGIPERSFATPRCAVASPPRTNGAALTKSGWINNKVTSTRLMLWRSDSGVDTDIKNETENETALRQSRSVLAEIMLYVPLRQLTGLKI